MSYAQTTTVAFEKSIAEIITLVKRREATQIGQFEGDDFFAVQFKLDDRLIRFRLPLPALSEMPLRDGRDGRGVGLSPAQRNEKLAQARRSRGRALLLVIKAKLGSVESRIETVEEAFLANIVRPGGQTVYDSIRGQLVLEYQTGAPGPVAGLLPPPGEVA